MFEGRKACTGIGRAADRQVDFVCQFQACRAQLDDEIAGLVVARCTRGGIAACRAEAGGQADLDRQRIELRVGIHIGKDGIGIVERQLAGRLGGVPGLAHVGEKVEPIGQADLHTRIDVRPAGIAHVEPDSQGVAFLRGDLIGETAAGIGTHAAREGMDRGTHGPQHEFVVTQIGRSRQGPGGDIVGGRRGRNGRVERDMIDRKPADADHRVEGLAGFVAGSRVEHAVGIDVALVHQLRPGGRRLHGHFASLLSRGGGGAENGQRRQRKQHECLGNHIIPLILVITP